MNIETERKFLVKDDSYKSQAIRSYRIKQGYIAHDSGNTVRVRIRDNEGFLTIKGPSANGISRQEWERPIPLEDVRELFLLCKPGVIDKTRWLVPEGTVPAGRFFEVDEFHGENEGLVMAEIELGRADEPFRSPAWLGQEVTGDKRYYNAQLSRHPYKEWGVK
ncbi:MAG: CYTH domain-containing protein [Bacteroidales bacterium]|nr:CYTH domain-containing protein [Bacteroidales bacterium]